MYICICNAITDRQIVAAAEQGARSPEDLAHGLGVGLGCGRCTSCAVTLLQETVAALTGAPAHCGSPVPGAAPAFFSSAIIARTALFGSSPKTDANVTK